MPSPIARPTIPEVNDSPRVAELRAKLDGVHDQEKAIAQDSERLQRERAGRRPMTSARELAGAYLASGATDIASFEVDYDASGASLEKQLNTNARRLGGLASVVRELEKNIAQAVREFSAQAARELMPHYEGSKLRNLTLRLGELGRAIEEEAAFRAEFEAKGLSVGYLLPAPFTAVGRLNDPGSRISMYLTEMKKRGVITQAEIAAFSSPENTK